MSILDKLLDFGADLFGLTEDAVHYPLWPIKPYMEVVVPGRLWRGSWPSKNMLKKLYLQGVSICINLCAERDQHTEVADAGMVEFHIPIVDNTPPEDYQVKDFITIVQSAASPRYVHCECGDGRTGCMVAAYRVLVQGWTSDLALKEAESYGLVIPAQKDFIGKLEVPHGQP